MTEPTSGRVLEARPRVERQRFCAALGRALANVVDHGVKLTGAADHGVSEAVYFDDPDGNGIEIYRDRAPEDWPRDAEGNLQMVNARLDLNALIAEGRAST